ncbi:MAG: T9SS type A sorting domain-containing protein [bacterium]
MKRIIIHICLMVAFPLLLSAQYSGGNGRGDAFTESLSIPVGIKEANREAIFPCTLKQNFPNPFSTVTNIEFTIVREERVRIAVYDITGCIVQTVLDESKKPGIYTATINGNGLNSGSYFCRISSGDYSQTKLMILIK